MWPLCLTVSIISIRSLGKSLFGVLDDLFAVVVGAALLCRFARFALLSLVLAAQRLGLEFVPVALDLLEPVTLRFLVSSPEISTQINRDSTTGLTLQPAVEVGPPW